MQRTHLPVPGKLTTRLKWPWNNLEQMCYVPWGYNFGANDAMNAYQSQSPRHRANYKAEPSLYNGPRPPVTPCSFELDELPPGLPETSLRGYFKERYWNNCNFFRLKRWETCRRVRCYAFSGLSICAVAPYGTNTLFVSALHTLCQTQCGISGATQYSHYNSSLYLTWRRMVAREI